MNPMYEVWYSKNKNPYPNDPIFATDDRDEAKEIVNFLKEDYPQFNFFAVEVQRKSIHERKDVQGDEARAKAIQDITKRGNEAILRAQAAAHRLERLETLAKF